MITLKPEVITLNRIRLGLTKEQLARKIGVAASSISRAERRKGTSARTVKLLSDCFQIDPAELIDFAVPSRADGGVSP